MNRTSSFPVVFVVCWCVHGLPCPLVSAQVPDASPVDSTLPQLLQPAKLVQQSSRVIGPEVVRRRAVEVDAELLMTLDPAGDNQIVFNLFPGVTFTGRVEDKAFPCKWIGFPDAFSLRGSIQGIAGSSFQLLYLQGVLAADIRVPGKGEYQIRPTASVPPGSPGPPGVHEVWEIDSSHVSECAAGRPLQFIPPAADKAVGQSTSFLVENGAVIEVLLVYTTDARIAMGGEINIIIETAFAVINTNTVFEDSLINTKLRFVDLREITYSESGIASTDLSRLTDIDDGYLDSLHTIRDETGADIVSLFVSSLDVCGTSWLMSNVSPDFQSMAFNVSAIGCVGMHFAFTHQLGHTLGCQHNREDAGGVEGAYPYSYGYLDPVGGFRTMMSLPNGSPLLRQFSNPLVVQNTGIPTGIPEGEANSADNAKTINNTAFTVANFRQTKFCPSSLDFDCNSNCIEDAIDTREGNSLDCNANRIPDECEDDCNANGIPDDCDIADGTSFDCNSNSIPDTCDIAVGSSLDCNSNSIPDECENDCNANCINDDIDIADGTSLDCNTNGIPDECEVDCNRNGIPDTCDLADGRSFDCNSNSIPDECEVDCNGNGIPDTCDTANGSSLDCNSNSIPDECESDCNRNAIPDTCDIADGRSIDCNFNSIPDECEDDCNGNGISDACDIAEGRSSDCNLNSIPDECDIADESSSDCNLNSIPDECDVRRSPSDFVSESGELSPIGLGFPVSHTLTNLPEALGDVTLRFAAIADLDSSQVSLDVYINDVFLGRIFHYNGSLCPGTPDEDELVVPMADFNTLVNSGNTVIRIETLDSVEFDSCNGSSWISVSLLYSANPDPAVADDNDNAIPDSCELALGDSNLDGTINVTDLLKLLAAWGVCDGCVEDTDGDGLINTTDLLTLLANWGPLV